MRAFTSCGRSCPLFGHRADRALSDLGGPADADRTALSRGGARGRGLWRLLRRVFSRSVYGGGLFDANGYPSFQAPIGPKTWLWDVNVTIFTLTSVILLAGIVTVVAT